MSQVNPTAFQASRPTPIILAAAYFFYITVVLRTLAERDVLTYGLAVTLGLELLFGILFTLVLWRPIRQVVWQHLYFIFQTLLVLFLLVPYPKLDFFNVLLVLVSFQAALIFRGRVRIAWVTALTMVIILSLAVLLGMYGLALSLLPAAIAIVFPAYVAVTQEIEAEKHKRQALLVELLEANRQLSDYASQVEELSTIQERNRLARELHDSVSQTMFSIGLHSRSARILLERDPDRLRLQLEQLQALAQNALAGMRSLIAELRPQENKAVERSTP